jgi:hypothetical protein
MRPPASLHAVIAAAVIAAAVIAAAVIAAAVILAAVIAAAVIAVADVVAVAAAFASLSVFSGSSPCVPTQQTTNYSPAEENWWSQSCVRRALTLAACVGVDLLLGTTTIAKQRVVPAACDRRNAVGAWRKRCMHAFGRSVGPTVLFHFIFYC